MSRFISTASRLAMAVAAHRARAAGAFNHHVREEQVSIDQHRRHVREVHRLFASADELRRVVHDAGRRDRHLRREQQVPAAEPARAEDVRTRQSPALVPEESHDNDYEAGSHGDPQRGAAGIDTDVIHLRLDCGRQGGRDYVRSGTALLSRYFGSRGANLSEAVQRRRPIGTPPASAPRSRGGNRRGRFV